MNPNQKNDNVDKSRRRSSIRQPKNENIFNVDFNQDENKPKNVIWDWKTLDEHELERKNNPKKKIDEPKTPYLPYVLNII